MALPFVSIIIPHYNGKNIILPCLEALRKLDYPKDLHEIIVVDDASTDESVVWMRDRFPQVQVVQTKTNLGFVGAIEVGISVSQAPVLAFLNNDTRPTADWLKTLVEPLHDKPMRCTTSLQLDWEGTHIIYGGAQPCFDGKSFSLHYPSTMLPNGTAPIHQLYPCGGAMAIYRDTYYQIGGFDADYRMIYEDVDLGWRLNLYGGEVLLVPESVVHHREHASLSELKFTEKVRYWELNALRTIIKNYETEHLDKILPAALALLQARRNCLLFGTCWPPLWLQQALKLGMRVFPRQLLVRELMNIYDEIIADAHQLCQRLSVRRGIVQTRRKRSDQDIIFRFFKTPFAIWGESDKHRQMLERGGYRQALDAWRNTQQLHEIFPLARD